MEAFAAGGQKGALSADCVTKGIVGRPLGEGKLNQSEAKRGSQNVLSMGGKKKWHNGAKLFPGTRGPKIVLDKAVVSSS